MKNCFIPNFWAGYVIGVVFSAVIFANIVILTPPGDDLGRSVFIGVSIYLATASVVVIYYSFKKIWRDRYVQSDDVK